jgi:hypothetical protein
MSDFLQEDNFYLEGFFELTRAQDFSDMMTDIRQNADRVHDKAVSQGIDLDEKAKRVGILFKIHKKATIELVAELYAVYKILHDPELKKKYSDTKWGDFCKEAGIHPETARNYIKKFYEEDEDKKEIGEEDLGLPTDQRKSEATIIQRKATTIRKMVEDNGKVTKIEDGFIEIEIDIHGSKQTIKVER